MKEMTGRIPPARLKEAVAEARSILIFRRGAVGDFVLTLPFINLLRRKARSARIVMMTRPENIPLCRIFLEGLDCVPADRMGMESLYMDGCTLAPWMNDFFAAFDLAILIAHDPDGIFGENLLRAGVKRLVTLPPFPPPGTRIHASHHLISYIEKGSMLPMPAPFIHNYLVEAARHQIAKMFGGMPAKIVSVHTGSGSAAKNWPVDHFADLIEAISSRKVETRAVAIFGPAESSLVEHLKSRTEEGMFLTVKDRPLEEVASFINISDVFIGADSGISHLAAALRKPTIVIFGPTEPEIWTPIGDDVTIVRSSMPCIPCGLDNAKKCTHRKCLSEIKPSQVMEILESLLTRESPQEIIRQPRILDNPGRNRLESC